jgi:molybdopterin-guanine dinucleotide biosynthesis adapter protein
MEQKKIPLVSIVGRSKTGKTTLVVKLIPLLKARGIRVATIKHHHLDFEIDIEGKDTYRHRRAGAALTMIVSPNTVAMVKDVEEEPALQQIVDRFVDDVDLIIVEGYKREPLPKIEVYTIREEPLATAGDPNLLAVVSDSPVTTVVPVFKRDDVQPIADLIARAVLGME